MSQPPDEIEALRHENARLRADNDELTARLAEVDDALVTLKDEALARRAEVRELAESLPNVVSRKAMLQQMASDVRHHPDKARMARRAVSKVGRGFRKLGRTMRDLAPFRAGS